MTRLSANVPVVAARQPYSDVNTVIGEDEGCVGGGELAGRHFGDGWEYLLKVEGVEVRGLGVKLMVAD